MDQVDIFESFGNIVDGICKSVERAVRATDHAIRESKELREMLQPETPPDDMTGDLFDKH